MKLKKPDLPPGMERIARLVDLITGALPEDVNDEDLLVALMVTTSTALSKSADRTEAMLNSGSFTASLPQSFIDGAHRANERIRAVQRELMTFTQAFVMAELLKQDLTRKQAQEEANNAKD